MMGYKNERSDGKICSGLSSVAAYSFIADFTEEGIWWNRRKHQAYNKHFISECASSISERWVAGLTSTAQLVCVTPILQSIDNGHFSPLPSLPCYG